MSVDEQEGSVPSSSSSPIELPRLRWPRLVAISILGFALNFHWTAISIIILPSQVLKMVGEEQKGQALATVLAFGAFVSLFASPLFGLLSDRMRGWMARWGRRRPYIFIGTFLNVIALVWMVTAPDISSLVLAYALLQFASNAIQSPFHALLPDIVPPGQRGEASGYIGLLGVMGSIGGTVVAGQFVNANLPMDEYQRMLWLTYGIIMAVLVAFMVITLVTVRESAGFSAQMVEREQVREKNGWYPSWLTRSRVQTILGTVAAIGLGWGIMALWNAYQVFGVTVQLELQQVILMVIATIGLMRIFEFRPQRYPDFAWVLVTRLVLMLGIYIIQTFLQYYLKDVILVPDPEAQSRNFAVVVAITSLISSFVAGKLSDSFGRKRMIYISGGMMALVGLLFIVIRDMQLVLIAGAIFGLGFGAYNTVDWALVADVLPDHRNYARDMGVWNVSLSLPQLVAPIMGGPLIDTFVKRGEPVIGYQIVFIMAIVFCVLGTVTVRYIKGVKK